jgi:hypothetical protein
MTPSLSEHRPASAHRARRPSEAFDFGAETYPGETLTIERAGFTLTARVYADDDSTPPWDRADGHGPVSDWRVAGYNNHPPKAPGERPLSRDGRAARFYDFAEAVRIAQRDGWGVTGGRLPGETARQYAARAVEADFQFLRGWCNDQWSYVGVAVVASRAGVDLTGEYECALWGIESCAGAWVSEVANELAQEAMKAARAKLAELRALDA